MADSQYTLSITGPAKEDLADIRRYTIRTHGKAAADRYDALLRQALKDLRDDPFRPGSKKRPEIAPQVRSYHISLSRGRTDSTVKSPRHLVLYYLPSGNEVTVSRVLHDARDLRRHLPDKWLEPPPEGASSPKRNAGTRDRGEPER